MLGPTFIEQFGPYRDPLTGKPKRAGGVVVRHHNNLPYDHRGFGVTRNTVHFHGGHVQAQADGFPEDLLNPPAGFPNKVVFGRGEHYDYFYPLARSRLRHRRRRRASTTRTAGTRRRRCGITTTCSTSPGPTPTGASPASSSSSTTPNRPVPKSARDVGDETDDRGLRLPSGPFDIPLVLQDKAFAADGSLVYSSFDDDGFLGDKICVNGAIQPYLRVQRRKYRFRFLNGSNARIYQIFLANGSGVKQPMTQIATEGGLLAAPIRDISSVLLYMAERIEVVIDFTNFAHGTELFLENRAPPGRRPQTRRRSMSRGPQILKFIVEGDRWRTPASCPTCCGRSRR